MEKEFHIGVYNSYQHDRCLRLDHALSALKAVSEIDNPKVNIHIPKAPNLREVVGPYEKTALIRACNLAIFSLYEDLAETGEDGKELALDTLKSHEQ